ncbi:histone deacetylase HDT2 [Amborella trichopoda]|uniref:histone deacetylase HDT2 n=1 Tax=Amborella trichopoda TaxID=13333 RepID=UPI0005D3861E|nr:histone deacetylase HDT2 [Amborella trichopoda]|eukprot:XP_011625987.1 histone deacetylase HDT2 [Amborella trichopoda]
MEFWGVEVKPGETVKCDPGLDKYIHLSQASLGESKKDKGGDYVPLFLKFGDQKIVIGSLSSEKLPQLSFDLVFQKEFELSHNWKHGSIFFCGYKTVIQEGESSDFSDSEEDDIPTLIKEENGRVEQPKPAAEKAKAPKPESDAAKPKVKPQEANNVPKPKAEDDDDDEDDEDDESEDDEDDSDNEDEDMLEASDDESDDEDDEDESSDEEQPVTPKKADAGKKRASDSAAKTPGPEKKAKVVTPAGGAKPEGKKGGHVATPYPTKQSGKTPAANDKQQTPRKPATPATDAKKSEVSCKSCNKTFKSDQALNSHNQAKHSASK